MSCVPLRELRRALKADPDADIQELRRRVLALEVAAERRVQARLAATVAGRPGRGQPRGACRGQSQLILGADFASRGEPTC